MKTLYDCRQKGELMVYTIGQFSKIGRVSTKTLRYYDEIELLKPVHVDRDTQYRYYSYEQVLKLISICELKERQPLVVISRRTITSMSNISSVIGKVFEDIFKMNLKPEGPVMTVYHDKQEFDIENADCEICIPVNSSVNAEKNEKIKEFKGGLVAATTFVGPYSRLGEVYAKVMKWINDNNKHIIFPF